MTTALDRCWLLGILFIIATELIVCPSVLQAQDVCTTGGLDIWTSTGADRSKFESLNANAVSVHLAAQKTLFFSNGYEVPAGSGVHPLFYVSPTFGGLVNGELRIVTSDPLDELSPRPLDAVVSKKVVVVR